MTTTKIPAELVAVNAIQGTLIADNAITSVHIAQNNITTTQIATNNITSEAIAQNNVTAVHILQNTITVTHLADSAVETAKINADAVTGAKLADNAVDSEHYTDGSIDTAHIGDLQVTAAKIGANAVTLAKMASLARGSILIGNSAADVTALGIGSANKILTSDGTDVTWSALNSGIDDNSNAVAMTIDSSERVAIGHTSAVSSSTLTLNGNQSALALSRNTGTDVTWTFSSDAENMYLSDDGNTTYNMMWKNNGNIGIRTTSPASGLHLTGADNTESKLTLTNTAPDPDNTWSLHPQYNSQNFTLSEDSTARVTFESGGNVGIGTTGPSAQLHVQIAARTTDYSASNASTWGDIVVTNPSGATNDATGIAFYNNASYHTNAATGIAIIKDSNSSDYGSHMAFVTRPHAAVAVERMRIQSDGAITMAGTLGVTGVTTIANTDSGQVNNESHVLIRNLANGNVITDDGLKMNCAENKLTVGGGTFITSGYIRSGAADMQFGTASQGVAITIDDTNKNVGIGEPTPIRRLVVNHPGGTSLHNGILLHADVDTANGTNGLYFKNDSTNTDTRIKAGIIFKRSDPGTRGTGSLHFCLERVNSDTNVATNHTMIYMGEDGTVQIGNPATGAATDFVIMPTAKLYLDAGGDTYISEDAANQMAFFTGGAKRFALIGGAGFFSGTVTASHSFSDERLKENITVIPNALDKIKTLRGITFTRKSDGSSGTGLIAQELEKVLPDAVYETKTMSDDDDTEYKAITYEVTVGLLVEGIKEQQTIIDDLKARIETLEG